MQATHSSKFHDQPDAGQRKAWLELLCTSHPENLKNLMDPIAQPAFQWLRKPQIGLYMVRGRMGGDGNPFNLGEVSVTRCVLRVDSGGTDGIVGLGYTLGRKPAHAALCAMADAMLQNADTASTIRNQVLAPLELGRTKAAQQAHAHAQATRVEFYSVARESGIGESL